MNQPLALRRLELLPVELPDPGRPRDDDPLGVERPRPERRLPRLRAAGARHDRGLRHPPDPVPQGDGAAGAGRGDGGRRLLTALAPRAARRRPRWCPTRRASRSIRAMPVQHDGRVMPFDTQARNGVWTVTKRARLAGYRAGGDGGRLGDRPARLGQRADRPGAQRDRADRRAAGRDPLRVVPGPGDQRRAAPGDGRGGRPPEPRREARSGRQAPGRARGPPDGARRVLPRRRAANDPGRRRDLGVERRAARQRRRADRPGRPHPRARRRRTT